MLCRVCTIFPSSSSKILLQCTTKYLATGGHTLAPPWQWPVRPLTTSPRTAALPKGKVLEPLVASPATAVVLDLPSTALTKEAAIPDYHCHVQKLDRNSLLQHYKSLSKFKLTSLVVATTITGYFIAPGALDPSVLAFTILGTGLTSCAANTLNQFLEIPYDSQMARTKNRVLVRGLVSPLHAMMFAGITGVAGVTTLALGVNGLTAGLGLANLVLYAGVYTPLKRCSILNTWVGAVVGAIPPVMGWAACTNSLLDPGAFVLGAILYSWQFPHFNALSWNLREDYSRAGYRMMAVTHPELCRRTALRHSIILTCVTAIAPAGGLIPWSFTALSLPLNVFFMTAAANFYHQPSAGTSRRLFRLSLLHLLGLVSLLVACEKLPPVLHSAREILRDNF